MHTRCERMGPKKFFGKNWIWHTGARVMYITLDCVEVSTEVQLRG